MHIQVYKFLLEAVERSSSVGLFDSLVSQWDPVRNVLVQNAEHTRLKGT
jgi:hypothetical protein